MRGLLINEKELKELQYVLRRELEELLFDFEDNRIDHIIKKRMEDRYEVIFKLFCRVANQQECVKYIRRKNNKKIK